MSILSDLLKRGATYSHLLPEKLSSEWSVGSGTLKGANMEYFEEVLDRRSGELVPVSKGDWITVSELGELHGVGRREVRTILRKMGVLHVEASASHGRHRLAKWIVEEGWGRRIERKGEYPFDVVGPKLREWIDTRWDATFQALMQEASNSSLVARAALAAFTSSRLTGELSVQQAVSWLADHFEDLTQVEMSMVLDVTQ
ncbi:MAG: hypothetical protein EON59_10075, partial [Alphaproteobacteria bacterium]